MKHLLLIEDDSRIALDLVENLEKKNFLVTHLKTISQTAAVDFQQFSLCIIDWNLPDGEGVHLVEKIRTKGCNVSVLMLTANSDSSFRKKALDSGVNDFLGKPFYFHELMARIELLLEDASLEQSASLLVSGSLRISKRERKVFYKSEEVLLAKKEFDLLLFFISNPNLVFSRNEVLDAVWGKDINLTPRTVDTHVLNLRKKINPDLIQTVWSSGYRYVADNGGRP